MVLHGIFDDTVRATASTAAAAAWHTTGCYIIQLCKFMTLLVYCAQFIFEYSELLLVWSVKLLGLSISLFRALYTSHECGYISLSIYPSHTYSRVCVLCALLMMMLLLRPPWYLPTRARASERAREKGARIACTPLCERSVDFCTTISSCPLCLTSLLIVKSEYRHPWINLPFNSIRLEDLYNVVECGGRVMVVLFHHFSPVIAQLSPTLSLALSFTLRNSLSLIPSAPCALVHFILILFFVLAASHSAWSICCWSHPFVYYIFYQLYVLR